MATVQTNTSTPYEAQINAASQKYGVPANLIKAVIKQESGFQNNARSGPGAAGLMQLMPGTAASLGVTNVWDPGQNIDGGTKYLAQQIKTFGSIPLALAAYNAGPGAVHAAGGKIPNIPETQNYVQKIMANYGSGNLDPSIFNTDSSSSTNSNPLDIGSTIVNGFQKIFQTAFTDTAKFFIYLLLFGLMIFFAYKALSGSPPINESMRVGKNIGRSVKRTVSTVKQNRYQAKKDRYNEELQKVKDRTPSDLKKGAKLLAELPK